MEARSLEVQHLAGTASLALLSGAQATKVFGSPGNDVGSELHLDPALGRTADGDVKEDYLHCVRVGQAELKNRSDKSINPRKLSTQHRAK